ncbi:MAG: AI-2E family transporter [Planctomycetota bacterium]
MQRTGGPRRLPVIVPPLFLFGALVATLVICSSILLPFALAMFFAYLIYPIVRLIHSLHIGKHHVPRWLGVILIYAAIIAGGIPLATKGFGSLKGQLTGLESNIERYVKTAREWKKSVTGFVSRTLEVSELKDEPRRELDRAFKNLWEQALSEAERPGGSDPDVLAGSSPGSEPFSPTQQEEGKSADDWLARTPPAFREFHDGLIAWIDQRVREDNTYDAFKKGPADTQAAPLEVPDEKRQVLVNETVGLVREKTGGRVSDAELEDLREDLTRLFEDRLATESTEPLQGESDNIYAAAQRLYRQHESELLPLGLTLPLVDAFVRTVKAEILGPAFAREAIADDVSEGIDAWLNELQTSVTQLPGVATHAQAVVESLIGGIFKTFLVMMVAAFFIVFFPAIRSYFRDALPPQYRDDYDNLLDRIDSRFAGVIRGQVLICTVNGILTYIGLAFLGVKYATLLAIIAGILSLIPIFGSIISTIPSALIAWTDSFTLALMVVGWVLVIHAIEAYLLNPNILGHTAHMNPLLVVFLLLAGEHFGGILGALLAVPIGSLFITAWVFAKRKASEWYERAHLATPAPPG